MKPNERVLLVEDEVSVASFINKGLTEQGYEVSVVFDGNSGLNMAQSGKFDLIILDIMLPGMNGIDVCRKIRQQDKKLPILLLTALGTAENVVLGFESEADDYLIKPFKFTELLARIRSLLRRTDGSLHVPVPVQETRFQFGDVVMNDYTKTVTRGEGVVALTSTEYRLLQMFLMNPRRVLSRLEILEHVWGVDFDMGTNVVDVYVNYLRKKIERSKGSKLIHTVIGMGYVLKEADEDSK